MIVCVFTAALFPIKIKTQAEKMAEEQYYSIQKDMLDSGKKRSIANTPRRSY